MNKFFLCSVVLSSCSVWAGDISECSKMDDKDKKNFCLANYAASATYCEKIVNGQMRRDCMFKVIRLQREITYQVPNYKRTKKEQKEQEEQEEQK